MILEKKARIIRIPGMNRLEQSLPEKKEDLRLQAGVIVYSDSRKKVRKR